MKQVLDRIFKEITGLRRVVKNDEDAEWNRAIYQCEEIVYKHMDDVPDADVFSWIPVEERLPEEGKYVLISFDNFPLADIGRYETDQEGGVFYPGDEEKSYISYGLFVNAWQPLPEPYKEDN